MTTYKHQKVDPVHTIMVRKLLQAAVVWLLVAVAAVSLALFTVVGWVEGQVLNTENWVSFVTPLPKDPVVADALGSFIASRLFDGGSAEIQQALPGHTVSAASLPTSELGPLTKTVATKVIAGDEFQAIWVAANRTAHQRLLERARGRTAETSAQNQRFQLNLDDVRPVVRQALGQAAATLPQHETPLQIEVDTHAQPQRLQQVVSMTDALQLLLPWLTVASLLGAVVWARNRRSVLLVFGELSVALALLQLMGARLLRPQVLNDIEDASYRTAGGVVYDSLLRTFNHQVCVVLAVVVWLLVACLLVGRNPVGSALRRLLRWRAVERTRYYRLWQKIRLRFGFRQYLLWAVMGLAAMSYLAFLAGPVDAKGVALVGLMLLTGMGLVTLMGTPPYTAPNKITK